MGMFSPILWETVSSESPPHSVSQVVAEAVHLNPTSTRTCPKSRELTPPASDACNSDACILSYVDGYWTGCIHRPARGTNRSYSSTSPQQFVYIAAGTNLPYSSACACTSHQPPNLNPPCTIHSQKCNSGIPSERLGLNSQSMIQTLTASSQPFSLFPF